jgi:hypothetical protein
MSTFAIEVPDDLMELTTFTGDLDLTDGSIYPGAKARGHARYIRVVDAGSLSLGVVMTGSGGVPRVLTVADGEELIGKFMTIVDASTDVAKIRVGW